MSKGRVLVTGNKGFIGGHVYEYLRKKGYDVYGCDLQEGYNITSYSTLETLPDVDYVCHIGAIGDTYECAKNPALAMYVNAYGTSNMLTWAKQRGVRRFIYASTWEVYGKAALNFEKGQEPLLIEAMPCYPDHPYNISKYSGEMMVRAYKHLHKMRTLSLRLGTAYGPNMRPNGVIPLFLRKMANDEDITIMGTGNQYRQFTYVSDIAMAFRAVIEASDGAFDLTDYVNIVGEERTTIRDLVKGYGKVKYAPARLGDPDPALVSSGQAKSIFGWEPKVEFRRGMKELAESMGLDLEML